MMDCFGDEEKKWFESPENFDRGATTFGIMTLSMTTLRVMDFFAL
jgi:hypothetical protein